MFFLDDDDEREYYSAQLNKKDHAKEKEFFKNLEKVISKTEKKDDMAAINGAIAALI